MMTIDNFDEAVVEYFESFYDYCIWGKTNEAFDKAAVKWGDQIPLPLISLARTELGLASLRNFALFKRGQMVGLSQTKVQRERILPMSMTYQADIWSDNLKQCTQLFSEVLFRTLDKPVIEVKFDNGAIDTKEIRLMDVVDNNDSTQISTRGRLYRFSIIYQVDGYIVKQIENDRIFIVPSFYTYEHKDLKKL